jgi:capsular polysaccharide biosynthesis protein
MEEPKKQNEGAPVSDSSQQSVAVRNVEQVSDDETQGRTFGDYWNMIKKHWIAIVIFVLAFGVAGVTYGAGIKKSKWQCTGSVLVTVDSSTTVSTNSTAEITGSTLYWVNTISDFLNDNLVLDAVTQDLINDGYTYSLSKTSEVDDLYQASPRSSNSTYATSLYIDVKGTSKDKTLAAKVVSYVLLEAQNIVDADYASSKAGSTTNGAWQIKSMYHASYPVIVSKASAAADTTGASYVHDANSTYYVAYSKLAPEDVSTKLSVIVLAAALIGLVVGIAYAIIREVTNVYVISKKELETLTGFKVIGMIPEYSNDNEKDKDASESKKEGK